MPSRYFRCGNRRSNRCILRRTLKIWMVDPGVVLDRMVIATNPLPDTYRAPAETAPVSYGNLSIGNGGAYSTGQGESTNYDTLHNQGELNVVAG